MGNKKEQTPEGFDTQNIFDDFSGSQNIQDEVRKVDISQDKDTFYYLKKASSLFFVCNIILFLGIIISVVYIFIQDTEEKREYAFLSPLCSLFLGETHIGGGSCYGVKPILREYQETLASVSASQAERISPLLGEVYSIENFNFSKRVSFLLQKSDERLKSLEILSAFDELKTRFAPRDKAEISCYNISVSQGNIMQLSCDVFSSDWDNTIAGLEDGNIGSIIGGGTSISRASSFIDFLENYSESPFRVLDKPEAFSIENVQNGPYTKKTTIQLQLGYGRLSDLSF